jgi:N-acetylmuramoyl-L-alanine amidase
MEINQNHFLKGCPVVPTPNKGGPLNPELIIVHDTAGALDYRGSVSWLCNPQAKASAHFVIGRAGEVTQLASCRVKTWHAGQSAYKGRQNVNNFAIGIEIANPGRLVLNSSGKVARASFGEEYGVAKYNLEFHQTAAHGSGWWMPYPKAQLDAVVSLCAALSETYNIKKLAAHFEISPGRKIDVGPQFPLSWLRAKIEGRADGDNSVEVEIGTPLRQWPSLFSENVLTTVSPESTFGTLISSGEFLPAGENLPASWLENPEKKILWHRVSINNTSGWVLAANVRML